MIFDSSYSRPVILAGNGVRTAGAADLVREFARKTSIPLLTTMNGVDLAPQGLHIGYIGTHGNRIANTILNQCDLIISVGARLGLRQVGPYSHRFAPQTTLVRADIDEYELSKEIKRNEIKYHTDAKRFMELLLREDVPDYTDWRNRCLAAKALLDDLDKQPGNHAVEKIASLLPENAIVSVDVGMHQCWCTQSLVLKGDKSRIHISGGYGTMGCALPFAIGSSIAAGAASVYCIAGDGGMQMNIQELETVRREQLPVKILVLNNRVLGKISETQHFYHGDRFANTAATGGYTVPNFQKIAEAYGIKAATLATYHDLEKYSRWLTDSEPCLLDISLPEQCFLTPKIQWETGNISPETPPHIYERVIGILQGTIPLEEDL